MRRLAFSQKNVIYLLVHAVLFVIGVLLIIAGGSAKEGVGAALAGTAVAGWAMFAYVLITDRWSRRLEMLGRFGIVDAFAARSISIREEYEGRLRRARASIDVLGFGQRALREDFGEHFSEWAASAHVRILLVDPDFPQGDFSISGQRDLEEQNDVGSIARDVHAFVRAARAVVTTMPDRFEIRLYRCLPAVNILRIDDDLFWGPYLIHEQSRNSPTFVVRRGGLLFDRLLAHFDTIWVSDDFSRPVPGDWLA